MKNQDLVTKAQNGNQQAFGEIYDLFAQRIYRHIKLKVQNQQQAVRLSGSKQRYLQL